jgi:hypothetical protein
VVAAFSASPAHVPFWHPVPWCVPPSQPARWARRASAGQAATLAFVGSVGFPARWRLALLAGGVGANVGPVWDRSRSPNTARAAVRAGTGQVVTCSTLRRSTQCARTQSVAFVVCSVDLSRATPVQPTCRKGRLDDERREARLGGGSVVRGALVAIGAEHLVIECRAGHRAYCRREAVLVLVDERPCGFPSRGRRDAEEVGDARA